MNFEYPNQNYLTVYFFEFQNQLPPAATFGGEPLTEVKEHKHLSIVLTNNLTWSAHIKEICNKANKRVNILASLKYKLDRFTLELMYNSFVRPVLEYGSQVWSNLSQIDAERLELIQIKIALQSSMLPALSVFQPQVFFLLSFYPPPPISHLFTSSIFYFTPVYIFYILDEVYFTGQIISNSGHSESNYE